MPIRLSAALTLLAAAGCTTGPPFGRDLWEEHHDPEVAAAQRDARFNKAVRAFDSHDSCARRLGALLAEPGHGAHGPVRLGPEALAGWRWTGEGDHRLTEEYRCDGVELRRRAWSPDAEAEAH